MTYTTQKLFVGIDISQKTLDIYLSHDKRYIQLGNNDDGISEFMSLLDSFEMDPEDVHIGMEATSGLQRRLLIALNGRRYAVFVINPEHVWAYRRSLGKRAKTDKIDSRLIAEYVELLKPSIRAQYSATQNDLKELSSRRKQYSTMIAKEKTRLKRMLSDVVLRDIEENITYLNGKMRDITTEIKTIIKGCKRLNHAFKLLKSIPGIGEVVAITLIAEMPELGALEGKQAASLVGVAPVVRESGFYKGASKIHGGRNRVRAAMYMSAFTAMHANNRMSKFAAKLKERGKPYRVIVVAIMRKLIVIANSVLKNNAPFSDSFA